MKLMHNTGWPKGWYVALDSRWHNCSVPDAAVEKIERRYSLYEIKPGATVGGIGRRERLVARYNTLKEAKRNAKSFDRTLSNVESFDIQRMRRGWSPLYPT